MGASIVSAHIVCIRRVHNQVDVVHEGLPGSIQAGRVAAQQLVLHFRQTAPLEGLHKAVVVADVEPPLGTQVWPAGVDRHAEHDVGVADACRRNGFERFQQQPVEGKARLLATAPFALGSRLAGVECRLRASERRSSSLGIPVAEGVVQHRLVLLTRPCCGRLGQVGHAPVRHRRLQLLHGALAALQLRLHSRVQSPGGVWQPHG